MMAHEEELKQAVELIKAGRKKAGGRILTDILNVDPENERAWLWVTACVDSDQERKYCLEQVLRINPNNQAAQKALAKLAPTNTAPVGFTDELPASQPPDSRFGMVAPIEQQKPEPVLPYQPDPAAGSPVTAVANTEGTPLPGAGLVQETPARRKTSALTIILSVLLGLVLVCGACAGIGYYYFTTQVERLEQSTMQEFQVEYIVSGSSPLITMTFITADGDAEAWDVRKTPYSRTYQMPGMTPLMLVAENKGQTGTVLCEIKVNGKTVSTGVSSEPEGQASCTGLAGLTE